jgi:putative membrane protein
MKSSLFVGIASVITGLFLSLGVAAAADQESTKANHADQHFFKEAAQGGMAEVTLGQMAAERATNADVKKFGQRMVQDHGKANQELQTLAASEGVTLPTEMSSEAKALQTRLSKLSGAEFDRVYMEEMLKDHKKDIAAFEKQAEQGKDSEAKNWAAKTLPTLKEHLTLAQSVAEGVGAKAETTGKSSERMSVTDSSSDKIRMSHKSAASGMSTAEKPADRR